MTETPDERLASFLDDLEQQASGVWRLERDQEVGERAHAEYSRVTLAGRLMASVGHDLELGVRGVGSLTGRLARVAEQWCLLEAGHGSSIVRLPEVLSVRGASARSVAAESWPVTSRLGLGSALRGVVGEPCVVRCVDGGRLEGVLVRVGADFVEIRVPDGRLVLLAFTAIATISR